MSLRKQRLFQLGYTVITKKSPQSKCSRKYIPCQGFRGNNGLCWLQLVGSDPHLRVARSPPPAIRIKEWHDERPAILGDRLDLRTLLAPDHVQPERILFPGFGDVDPAIWQSGQFKADWHPSHTHKLAGLLDDQDQLAGHRHHRPFDHFYPAPGPLNLQHSIELLLELLVASFACCPDLPLDLSKFLPN